MIKTYYYTETKICFSHEDFMNAGLSSDQIKKIIESIEDPFGYGTKFYCQSTGINGNWSITTRAKDPEDVYFIVELIEQYLFDALHHSK